jgi:hypothetical protein
LTDSFPSIIRSFGTDAIREKDLKDGLQRDGECGGKAVPGEDCLFLGHWF